jgi:hypothetical protein
LALICRRPTMEIGENQKKPRAPFRRSLDFYIVFCLQDLDQRLVHRHRTLQAGEHGPW